MAHECQLGQFTIVPLSSRTYVSLHPDLPQAQMQIAKALVFGYSDYHCK